MAELIAPPDCAKLVADYLEPLLDVSASSLVPRPRPGRFLRVVQVPSEGFTGKILFRGRLSCEAWGNNVPEASDLAAQAIAHLEAATEFYAECSGPGFLADPQTGLPRYLFVADLAVRGQLL